VVEERCAVYLHEGIVHGHDKDLAGIFELGVRNVAGDVRVRACWACESVRRREVAAEPLEWSCNADRNAARRAPIDSHS
jgi:hypothetical protein